MTTNNELEQGLLDSMKEFEGMLETNNDHAAALELWEAMGEVRTNKPSGIMYLDGSWLAYLEIERRGMDWVEIPESIAYPVIKDHAEQWLRERGWTRGRNPELLALPIHSHCGLSLPAAIRAEAGRG